MGRPQKRLNSWDVIELASWGHMPAAEIAHLWRVSPSTIRRRFAPELAQAKAERALQFRQFTAEIPSRAPTERSVQISRTTLFRSWFTVELLVPGNLPGHPVAISNGHPYSDRQLAAATVV
jgi:hypothetical protein